MVIALRVVSQDKFPRSSFLQDIRPRNRTMGVCPRAKTLIVQVTREMERIPKENSGIL